jgi:hypothetical protein
VFAPTWENLFIFEAFPVEWMDDDGAVLSRVLNLDAYEATLKYYCNFGGDNSRLQAVLSDVSES